MTTTAPETTLEARLLVGGEWRDAAAGATFEGFDPFTELRWITVQSGTRPFRF